MRMGSEKQKWNAIPTTLSCLFMVILGAFVLRSEYRHHHLEKRVFELEENTININNHRVDDEKTATLSHYPSRSKWTSSNIASRVRRMTQDPNDTSTHDQIRSDVRHVIRSLFNLFCAKDQKLCMRGPKGEIGSPGTRGPRGKQGVKGDKGNRGQRGKRGPKGKYGGKGQPGQTGSKGEKGDPGISVTAPSILVGPNSTTVTRYSNVSFTCSASGLPVPDIKWSGERRLGKHHVIRENTLWLLNTTLRDQGVYTCTASSVLGSVSKSALLIVHVPVLITTRPKPTIVEEGRLLSLLCKATGNPTPQITWGRISGSLDSRRVMISGGNLTINSTSLTDSDIYKCIATNLLNVQQSTTNVIVVPRLRFTSTPESKNVSLLLGTRLRLRCEATSGSFKPQVTWARDGAGNLNNFTVLNNGTLMKNRVELKDSGVYVCTAKNIAAQISRKVLVSVANPRSCSHARQLGNTVSGHLMIDPDGPDGLDPPFRVYCDMQAKNQVGVTVISHNSEQRTLVNGYECQGCYSRDIVYIGVKTSQLASLTRVSARCEQYIKYECHHSDIEDSWWVSRDGVKMINWGEAPAGSHKCRCGMTKACANNRHCNCDNNDEVWREDSGYLNEKSYLPVSQLRFGDTGGSDEKGYYTLGKLKCFG